MYNSTIMKHVAVQILAFLIIALTPFASWFVLPLYVLVNPLFALASAVLVLATSRQVGQQLEVERKSFAWVVLQAWYWTNVVLTFPCLLLGVLYLCTSIARSFH
jgi:uncharacterized membrane protein YvlD (DUF360 family)